MRRVSSLIWYLQRFSGILLLIGLAVHFWVLHFANKTGEYIYKDVAERLSNPSWKAFYIVFLVVVIYHAMVGLRMVIFDFRIPNSLRRLVSIGLLIAGVILFLWGMNSLLSVKPL
jgi:succinate dehydrogenase / fumarate reductase membrane anchor subunit